MRWRITPKFLSSGEHKNKLFVRYETTTKLFFPFDLFRVRTKITQSYSFHSIYPRVRTKITPKQIHIHNTQSNTTKSAPRFLSEKQRQERASTPMHRLPQCHLGNPRVECQNIRTSKSAPIFLPGKQRQEHASTPMQRLPQCHLGNSRVGPLHLVWRL